MSRTESLGGDTGNGGGGGGGVVEATGGGVKETEYWRYHTLYKAAITGDWPAVETFYKNNPEAVAAIISPYDETALHVAVGTNDANHFVTELVKLMPIEALAKRSGIGFTALCTAAATGNVEAASVMVVKHPGLVYIQDNLDRLPIHIAAQYGRRDILKYLEMVTDFQSEPGPLALQHGRWYEQYLIASGLYDIALDFSKKYPDLVTPVTVQPPLLTLSRMPNAFPSSCRFNFWENLIYRWVPFGLKNVGKGFNRGDIENPTCKSSLMKKGVFPGVAFMFWAGIAALVPRIKCIQADKLVHHQASELLKWSCHLVTSSKSDLERERSAKDAIFEAAARGTYEMVEEIVDAFPASAWMKNGEGHYILQLAVVNRCEKVFNLIYQMSDWKEIMISTIDTSGNNILHLAGKLAPLHKLNLVSGAALQMQRELQWFKVVEEFVSPANRENMNSNKETPRMVFTREHQDLVREGERWMKDTANSCTITAALITTIAFAAAITVPGGNDQNTGLPFFAKSRAFVIFAVACSISLFTSTISLLIFLGILTARYAEHDFLITLPRRLILGLITLFMSITSMLLAYSATIYWMFGQGERMTPIGILIGLSCLPITSFAMYQFPLLVDVISSTYGPGIFVKQSNRLLY